MEQYLSNHEMFCKTGRFFVDTDVVKTNLSQFLEINFHLLRIRATKSSLKQEINLEIFYFLKYVSRKVTYIPIYDTYIKHEGGFCSLFYY